MADDSGTGSAARTKGPLVWLDMDQKALDDAYDQAVYAPNQKDVHRRRGAASARARAALAPPLRFAYGANAIEQLDIYRVPDTKAPAPILIFIHGGAWKNGASADFAAPAEMLTAAGVHYVVPDFTNVTETGGDLRPMAAQVRAAIAWVWANAATFGGDRDRIHLAGHSSGAHLSSCALITDWRRAFDVPADILKSGTLISGMYDLKPVRLSKRSDYVNFTDEIEQELSAIRHLERLTAPLVVAHGDLETPEFQRQARDFAAAVKAAGKAVELIVGEGQNHFELPETLANPYGLIGRAVLKTIGVGRG